MKKNRQTTFNFKRFSLRNEHSGMKVGTDGVVLGTWANVPSNGLVLDVGTGTGLIALMVAQRTACKVVGIEIDEVASVEAKENADSSPFRDRVEIIHTDFVDYAMTTNARFDVIVSNPPYFQTGMRAESNRGVARHEGPLNVRSLIDLGSKILSDNGEISLIAPFEAYDDICFQAVMSKMCVAEKLEIVTRTGRDPIRVSCRLTKKPTTLRVSTLTIQNSDGSFAEEYINLTKEFYLNF